MKIKFCGMKLQKDLDFARKINSDFCGFIFHPESPRYIPPQEVARLNTHGMKRIGVFVKTNPKSIQAARQMAQLDYIQLHGNYTRDQINIFEPETIIRVIWPQRYAAREELQKELDAWANSCCMFLLDSGLAGGGSGKQIDWKKLAQINFPRPYFLAGGISPENIQEILNHFHPFGLDINSCVEDAPGVKNHELMRRTAIACKKEIYE